MLSGARLQLAHDLVEICRRHFPAHLVCKGGPGQSKVLITEATLLGIPVIEDTQLARTLNATCAVGDPLPDAVFQPVADILVAARLV